MSLKKILNNWKQFDSTWWITELISMFILMLFSLVAAYSCVTALLDNITVIQKVIMLTGYLCLIYFVSGIVGSLATYIRRKIRKIKK